MARCTFANMFAPFPGKVMLFGEYGLLKGSNALTVPSTVYYGQLAVNPQNPAEKVSQQSLLSFCQHLFRHFGDFLFLDVLQNDLNQQLHFKSNIPQGYGVGSSAALVAAIAKVYGKNLPKDLEGQKALFGEMESFFHGKSSGLDVLVCYQQQPILIEHGQLSITTLPQEISVKWELVDTEQIGMTAELVQQFKAQPPGFFTDFEAEYIEATNLAVQSFLGKDIDTLSTAIKRLSFFTIDRMAWAIHHSFQPTWEAQLASPNTAYKLCGSGGGGFMLKFSW